MFIIKNIFAFLTAAIVMISSNGFILEQYFCSDCQSEHSEVAFFEFGEISHEHEGCHSCVSEHQECNCNQDDHLNNTTITFFALDLLFLNSQNQEKSASQKIIEFKAFSIPSLLLSSIDNHISLKEILKKPIDKHITLISKVILAQISVFRL